MLCTELHTQLQHVTRIHIKIGKNLVQNGHSRQTWSNLLFILGMLGAHQPDSGHSVGAPIHHIVYKSLYKLAVTGYDGYMVRYKQ